MENVAYEDSSADNVPTIVPVIQNCASGSRSSCRCEEENSQCHCKNSNISQWKIESHPWSTIKGYMLIGVVASLVLWCAVYFTLLGLNYV